MGESLCKANSQEPWRVLEFYSGIGGMRYPIMEAGVEATMVESFDINDKANDVYAHNFGHRPYQTSDTHKQMVEMLKKTTQEFILSPLQFGVPYSRPRYFCLAKREPLKFLKPHFNNQLMWNPSPLSDNDDNTWTNGMINHMKDVVQGIECFCQGL
ncbi:hypothetical protein MKX03_032485 [Papaver bracteatum]|nr:hypothetical protein MKX03_032485 [Papaver bracteatum]